MTPEEVTHEVRRLEITTRHLVRDIMAGEYSSAFRGRGVEFAEVREYQPGDDIRTIDWNVTARLGSAYVKRFLEERELTILFLADVSASGGFGTRRRTKGELAIEVTAVLALFAVPEMIALGTKGGSISAVPAEDKNFSYRQLLSGVLELPRHWWLVIRTSIIGSVIGMIPGLGGSAAAWLCYGHAVQSSKTPELPTRRIGKSRPSHRQKSPTTLTRRAFGAQTANAVPSTPSMARR